MTTSAYEHYEGTRIVAQWSDGKGLDSGTRTQRYQRLNNITSKTHNSARFSFAPCSKKDLFIDKTPKTDW